VSLVLIIAGFSVKKEKTIGPITLLIIIVTLVVVWVFTVQGSLRSEELVRFFTTISFSLIGALIFLNIITTAKKGSLESDFIWGGIATYLLIGLAFASVYHLVELNHSGSFSSSLTPPSVNFADFIYFSYFSLTTIGGALTPNTLQAQSLVMLEPIIGTLFIAILISRLVSIVGSKENQNPKINK
jgi:hypothetical protein